MNPVPLKEATSWIIHRAVAFKIKELGYAVTQVLVVGSSCFLVPFWYLVLVPTAIAFLEDLEKLQEVMDAARLGLAFALHGLRWATNLLVKGVDIPGVSTRNKNGS